MWMLPPAEKKVHNIRSDCALNLEQSFWLDFNSQSQGSESY